MPYIGQRPAPSAVTSSDITDGAISTAKLADSSVTSAKITNGTIASADLASGVGGKVLQSLSTAITAATGTTTIPNDDTTPTSSEGTEFFSQAITPSSSSNKILITGAVSAENSAGNGVVVTVFRGSTCIASYVRMEATGTVPGVMAVHVVDAPSTTSATTYSCRIGGQGAGTWAVARRGTPVYNGTMAGATFTVQEIGA